MTIDLAFRAGFTRRWHTNPHLAHTNDRIDGHAGRVARIILMLNEAPSIELIKAALTHDDGESITGDLPGPFKSSMPGLAIDQFEDAEMMARNAIWGSMSRLSRHESLWLKLADRLDAYLWCAWHAPKQLKRADWVAALEWIDKTAGELDARGRVLLAILEVVEGNAA